MYLSIPDDLATFVNQLPGRMDLWIDQQSIATFVERKYDRWANWTDIRVQMARVRKDLLDDMYNWHASLTMAMSRMHSYIHDAGDYDGCPTEDDVYDMRHKLKRKLVERACVYLDVYLEYADLEWFFANGGIIEKKPHNLDDCCCDSCRLLREWLEMPEPLPEPEPEPEPELEFEPEPEPEAEPEY